MSTRLTQKMKKTFDKSLKLFVKCNNKSCNKTKKSITNMYHKFYEILYQYGENSFEYVNNQLNKYEIPIKLFKLLQICYYNDSKNIKIICFFTLLMSSYTNHKQTIKFLCDPIRINFLINTCRQTSSELLQQLKMKITIENNDMEGEKIFLFQIPFITYQTFKPSEDETKKYFNIKNN